MALLSPGRREKAYICMFGYGIAVASMAAVVWAAGRLAWLDPVMLALMAYAFGVCQAVKLVEHAGSIERKIAAFAGTRTQDTE